MAKGKLKRILLSSVTIPLFCSCSANGATQAIYKPAPIERSTSVSQKAKDSYLRFVEEAVTNFFGLYQTHEKSVALSLPDLFLCYNMMATISEDPVQSAYLSSLSLESVEELQEVSREIISYLVFKEEPSEEKNKTSESGAINLNGFFYDPTIDLRADYQQYLQAFAEYFNAYSFNSKPSKEIIDSWIKESDEDGYLSEVPVPEIDENSFLAIVSSYAIIDSFKKDTIDRLERLYKEGSNTLEYTLEGGETKTVDRLGLDASSNVYFYDEYTQVNAWITHTGMQIYYPEEGVDVDYLSTTIFAEREAETKHYDDVYARVPMFKIESSLEAAPSDFIPSFDGLLGSRFFDPSKMAEIGALLSQNNNLTLDYHGFKGASITVMQMTETAEPTERTEFILEVERPFLFSLTYGDLPLYYGKIHDPGYPRYGE